MKYYSMFWSQDFDEGELPMGWLEGEYDELNLYPDPAKEPLEWPTPVFELRVVIHAEPQQDEPALEFPDYLANSQGWPICSIDLKQIVDEARTEQDRLTWLPVTVMNDQGDSQTYYVARFPEAFPETIDQDGTLFNDAGTPVRIVFEPDEIGKHGVFAYRERPVGMIVSEAVKERVEQEQLTGLEFEEENIGSG